MSVKSFVFSIAFLLSTQLFAQKKLGEYVKFSFDKKLLTASCNKAGNLLEKGVHLLEHGNTKEANRYLKLSLECDCDNAELLNSANIYRAIALSWLKDSSCFEYFNRAIMYDKNNAYTYLYKGFADYAFYNYANALIDYNTVERLDSAILNLYDGRGKLYFEMDSSAKAKKDFDFYLQFDDNCDIRFCLGQAQYVLEDFDSCIINLLKVQPCIDKKDIAELDYYLAWAYYKLDSTDKAQLFNNKLGKATTDNGILGDVYLLDGMIQLDKGDVNKAEEYFLEALKKDSSMLNAYYYLADISILKRKFDKAKAYINRIETSDSTDHLFLLAKAHYYLEQKQIKDAKNAIASLGQYSFPSNKRLQYEFYMISALVNFYSGDDYCSMMLKLDTKHFEKHYAFINYENDIADMLRKCK